jgi:hypothetical protein
MELRMTTEIPFDELTRILEGAAVESESLKQWSAFLALIVGDKDIQVSDQEADPTDLVPIYSRRLAHLRNKAWRIGGFEATIDALRKETEGIRFIGVSCGRHAGVWFMSPDLTRAIGFLYVEKPDKESGAEPAVEQHPFV